jgi:hypothetical protein
VSVQDRCTVCTELFVELLAAFPQLLSSQSLLRVAKVLLLQSDMCIIAISILALVIKEPK